METKFRTMVFGFLDILGESWKIYKVGFTNFLLITLVVYLPYLIFSYFYSSWYISTSEETSLTATIVSCGYSMFSIGITLFYLVAVAYLVEELVQGRTTSFLAALHYALLKWPVVFLIQLLFGVIVGIGTVLLIIPGLIIGVYLAFTYLIVALRKIGLQAFQYSINLVKGQWWRVFWIFVGIGIITFAFNYLLGWVIRISAPYIGFGTILISLIGYLVALLFAIYQVVFFLNQDYLKHPVKIDPSIPEQGIEAQIVES